MDFDQFNGPELEKIFDKITKCLRKEYEKFFNWLDEKIDDWIKNNQNKDSKIFYYLSVCKNLITTLWKCIFDKRIPLSTRVNFGFTMAYVIFPLDLFPDFIFPLGILEDVVLVSYVLNSFINKEGKEIVEEHWPGDDSALKTIQEILDSASDVIGPGLFQRIKKALKGSFYFPKSWFSDDDDEN